MAHELEGWFFEDELVEKELNFGKRTLYRRAKTIVCVHQEEQTRKYSQYEGSQSVIY